MAGVVSADRIQQLAIVGAGAAAAGFVQASGMLPGNLSPNVRDLVLTGLGVVLASMNGPMLRAFGVGFGAVPVGALITRTLLTGVGGGLFSPPSP